MRGAWLGVLSCVVLGSATITACGDAFSEASDDGGGAPDGADDASNGDEGVGPLEGGPTTDGPMPMHDAHADVTVEEDTGVDAGMDVTIMPDSMVADSMPIDSPVDTSTPDMGVVQDACTLATATDVIGAFVQQGGSGALCTKLAPCGTISAAIGALSGRHVVYVAQGNYTDQITLVSNVTVQGGWIPGAWTRNCDPTTNAAATIVTAPTNVNQTVIANGVTGVTLDTFTVHSKAAASVAAGESIYGIFATGGANLTLLNVDVVTAKAGDGVAGVDGGPAPAQAANTCAWATGSTGVDAVAGLSATGPSTGVFSAVGYTPRDGADGQQGGTGQNGIKGADSTTLCATGVNCSFVSGDGICEATSARTSCGTEGTVGCGGAPGAVGTAGRGGGSSIALYAWNATITATGGALTAGSGGNGGNAGLGGMGGAGGAAGSAGTAGATIPTANCRATPTPCAGLAPFGAGGAGGAGGPGGRGAAGGLGSGGSGGYSYSYYFGGGAVVSPSGTGLNFGSAGVGGGVGGAGAAGNAAQHN